jgi:hypothetical protein
LNVYFSFMPETHSSYSYNAVLGLSEKNFDVSGNRDNHYLYKIYYDNATIVTKSGSIFCPKWDKPTVVINIDL